MGNYGFQDTNTGEWLQVPHTANIWSLSTTNAWARPLTPTQHGLAQVQADNPDRTVVVAPIPA